MKRARRGDVDLVDVQQQLERRREAFANVDIGDGVTRGGAAPLAGLVDLVRRGRVWRRK